MGFYSESLPEDDYPFVDENGTKYSYEEMQTYFDFIGVDKDNCPIFRVKPEYKKGFVHNSAEVGLAVVGGIFRFLKGGFGV